MSLREWRERGQVQVLAGHRVFTLDIGPSQSGVPPATGVPEAEVILVIHGFPTSSFDFRHVVPFLARDRRVLLVDLVGFGLSDKPDIAYTLDLQADVVSQFTESAGATRVALVTHDMGDTVGGELLARQREGRWPVEVTRRLLFNGSIYIEMAHLSAGQLLLLDLPDAALAEGQGPDEKAFCASLAATFSPGSQVDPDELPSQWELAVRQGGTRLLPRTIRYIEERRRNQDRYTGAIETHPSPLAVVWGADDPIAVPAMVERLQAARPDAGVVMLDGVGHFLMVEAPGRLRGAMSELGW